jgi:hypothetical protein
VWIFLRKLRGNYSETLSGSGRGIKIFPFLGRVGDTAHLTTGGQHLAPAQTQYSSTGKEKLKYTRNRILHIYPAKDVPALMCTGRREYTH